MLLRVRWSAPDCAHLEHVREDDCGIGEVFGVEFMLGVDVIAELVEETIDELLDALRAIGGEINSRRSCRRRSRTRRP